MATTSPDADKPHRVAAVRMAHSGRNAGVLTHKGYVVLHLCTFPDFVTNSS